MIVVFLLLLLLHSQSSFDLFILLQFTIILWLLFALLFSFSVIPRSLYKEALKHVLTGTSLIVFASFRCWGNN